MIIYHIFVFVLQVTRQRIKRVTMRDTLFVLEHEKDIRRKSNFMFKPFSK